MRTLKSLFSYIDYRTYIAARVENEGHGYKARLAGAADCQRSFLSQVLKGQADLMPEHAIGIAKFWGLTAAESDHFLTMVSYARAGTKTLRDHFRDKLERTKKDQEDLVKRIAEKAVLPEISAAVFYSTWQYIAINILITIPQIRTVARIAQRLSLSEDVVRKSLAQLEQLGLVVANGSEWLPVNATIHLPRDSQFNTLNHSHWRQKAIENAFLADESSVHYTSVCTLSLDDAQKIKDLVLQLVDQSRAIVTPSKEEELFCLTCDWFKV